jgi:putative endonuclease
MYFVYILKSLVARKSYVGISNNPERRIGEHNSGKSCYTKKYKPWRLVFKESFPNRKEARKREKYLKTSAGRKYLKKYIFKD